MKVGRTGYRKLFSPLPGVSDSELRGHLSMGLVLSDSLPGPDALPLEVGAPSSEYFHILAVKGSSQMQQEEDMASRQLVDVLNMKRI